MADFGGMFFADDGTLLVTSDTPVYEHRGSFNPTSRSGNVSVYVIPTVGYPLVFVRCGSGKSAGVLAIEGVATNWVVSVLTDVSCPIEAFTTITSAGMAKPIYIIKLGDG